MSHIDAGSAEQGINESVWFSLSLQYKLKGVETKNLHPSLWCKSILQRTPKDLRQQQHLMCFCLEFILIYYWQDSIHHCIIILTHACCERVPWRSNMRVTNQITASSYSDSISFSAQFQVFMFFVFYSAQMLEKPLLYWLVLICEQIGFVPPVWVLLYILYQLKALI